MSCFCCTPLPRKSLVFFLPPARTWAKIWAKIWAKKSRQKSGQTNLAKNLGKNRCTHLNKNLTTNLGKNLGKYLGEILGTSSTAEEETYQKFARRRWRRNQQAGKLQNKKGPRWYHIDIMTRGELVRNFWCLDCLLKIWT